jgi:drug/metabolite transporter (DMT)-like permease
MRAELSLALVALIWGSTFVLVKEALRDISPLLYLALRFTLAAVLLVAWFRKRLAKGFTRVHWGAGMLAGSILMLSYVLQTVGLQSTTPSKSAFLTGLYVVLVPFAAALVYWSRPRLLEVGGVLVAGTGMGLLSLPEESLSISRGDLLTIGCAVGFAVHIVVLGYWAPRVGYEPLSLLQIVGAAVVAIVATPFLESPVVRWSPAVVMAILVGGVLATALAFVLQTWAQERTTPARAAILFSLEPVFAWLFSWVWAGESLSGRAALGAVLILAGILLVELKPVRGEPHPLG